MKQLFWLVVAAACTPLLWRHLANMWRVDAYHYLPALGLILGILVWQRWDRELRLPNSVLEVVWLGIGVASIGSAVGLYSPWIAAFSAVVFFGLFFYLHEDRESGNLLGIWPITFLLVPLPAGLDDALTAFLQRQSSRLSSFVLDFLTVPHTLAGNVIELPQGRLFVEDACSGVQSLFTLLFVGTVVVSVNRRPTWQLPFYLIASVFWAAIMNVARLVTIAWVRFNYGWDWSHGTVHQAVGYFYLALAILMLLSTDRLFRIVFFPTNPDKASKRVNNPLLELWNWATLLPSAVRSRVASDRPNFEFVVRFSVLILVFIFAAEAWAVGSRTLANPPVASASDKTPFFAFPSTLPLQGVTITSHENVKQDLNLPFGHNADVWQGLTSGIPITLAISQPYPKWHNLCDCYTGIGWILSEYEVDRMVEGSPHYSRAVFVHPDGRYAYLWFSAFDDQGNLVAPASGNLLERFKYYVLAKDRKVSSRDGTQVAIAQMMVESSGQLDPVFRSELSVLFENFEDHAVDVMRREDGNDA